MGRYTHPNFHFQLEVPDGLEIIDTLPTVALLAREPDSGGELPVYPARLTVAVDALTSAEAEAAFAEESLALQLRELAGARLIDSEAAELGGLAARRTLMHLRDGPHAVCCEQWHLVHRGRGYTVGAAWGTLELPPIVSSLRAAALSFRPGSPSRLPRESPSFDPALGLLLVDDSELQELAAGERSAPLARAGALLDGAPHPTVAPALEVMRAPVCVIEIDVRGDRGRAWCGPQGTALALPPRSEEAPRRRLVSLPTAFLPTRSPGSSSSVLVRALLRLRRRPSCPRFSPSCSRGLPHPIFPFRAVCGAFGGWRRAGIRPPAPPQAAPSRCSTRTTGSGESSPVTKRSSSVRRTRRPYGLSSRGSCRGARRSPSTPVAGRNRWHACE